MKDKKLGVLDDIKYMCASADIITEALKSGCDVAQLPNGDIIVTQVRVVNTKYKWNEGKGKMIAYAPQEEEA